VLLTNLDDFRVHDLDQSVINDCPRESVHNVYRQLEMITRVYAQDSKAFKDQSSYWMTYAYRQAANVDDKENTSQLFDNEDDSDMISNIKRLEGLRLAIMIDDNQHDEAKSILESFLLQNEFTHQDQDVKLLMTSLLGILKKSLGKTQQEQMEGLKLLEKAQSLSEEIKLIYERLRWFKTSNLELGIDPVGVKQGVMAEIINEVAELIKK